MSWEESDQGFSLCRCPLHEGLRRCEYCSSSFLPLSRTAGRHYLLSLVMSSITSVSGCFGSCTEDSKVIDHPLIIVLDFKHHGIACTRKESFRCPVPDSRLTSLCVHVQRQRPTRVQAQKASLLGILNCGGNPWQALIVYVSF